MLIVASLFTPVALGSLSTAATVLAAGMTASSLSLHVSHSAIQLLEVLHCLLRQWVCYGISALPFALHQVHEAQFLQLLVALEESQIPPSYFLPLELELGERVLRGTKVSNLLLELFPGRL